MKISYQSEAPVKTYCGRNESSRADYSLIRSQNFRQFVRWPSNPEFKPHCEDRGLLCWACFHIPRPWTDLNKHKYLNKHKTLSHWVFEQDNSSDPQWGSGIFVPDQEDYCYRGASPALRTQKTCGEISKMWFLRQNEELCYVVEMGWAAIPVHRWENSMQHRRLNVRSVI